MESIENVAIIIPSLNPDEKLMKVVSGLIEAGYKKIVLVNDGSNSEHEAPFEEAKKHKGCVVLKHEVNRGKGAGLKTAFKYITETWPDLCGVVTVDGDNQHTVKDITACKDEMVKLKDTIVIGCRAFDSGNVPARSAFGNNVTRKAFRLFCGMDITDTQTGLRAIPLRYLQTLIELKGDRFEYETRMLLIMKEQEMPWVEVPIETVYIEENRTSHFNPVKDSIKIYASIFKYSPIVRKLAKFAVSSGVSFVVEYIIFWIMLKLLKGRITENEVAIFASTVAVTTATYANVIARICSSVVNYSINHKVVFKSAASHRQTVVRYYILCVCQLIVGTALLTLIVSLFRVDADFMKTLCKFVVDVTLFLLSFNIQRKWVFAGKQR